MTESSSAVAFTTADNIEKFPAVEAEVTVGGLASLSYPDEEWKKPMNSGAVSNVLSAGKISKITKIGYFDAGQNGKLPIWEVRSSAYDVFVVLIVRDHVVVDVCLRGDDADDLVKYLGTLKELTRGIQIVKPKS